jgi:hypothetical protein
VLDDVLLVNGAMGAAAIDLVMCCVGRDWRRGRVVVVIAVAVGRIGSEDDSSQGSVCAELPGSVFVLDDGGATTVTGVVVFTFTTGEVVSSQGSVDVGTGTSTGRVVVVVAGSSQGSLVGATTGVGVVVFVTHGDVTNTVVVVIGDEDELSSSHGSLVGAGPAGAGLDSGTTTPVLRRVSQGSSPVGVAVT